MAKPSVGQTKGVVKMKEEEYVFRRLEDYGNIIGTYSVEKLGASMASNGVDKTTVIQKIADAIDPLWALTHTMADFRELCEEMLRNA